MTAAPDIVVLADHSVLLAIPALAPAFVVAGVVIFIAMRNRRNDGARGENSTASDQDGSP
jgi:hypothetical protein